MTVTYSLEVSRTRLGGFAKLLLRWRGSIYRLVYREVIIFTLLYYSVAVLYRYALPESYKRSFEEISRYCREFTDLIPITFIMGFYVAVVVGRWWQQYLAIPWPDRCCFQVAAFVQGNDERGRLIRRGLARYLNLLAVLTMQATSTVVRKRFPTVEHLMQAGLMTEEERIELELIEAPHGNWWVPASWFCQLAMQARKEGRIHDDLHLKSLIDDALALRGSCGLMWSFDWISVPLVYTQVVTLVVYIFFCACLFGRQYLERASIDGEKAFAVDYYVPVFTFFQFFFYMGWLKVAEQLINPYGEDDDDFELSWIIDRNLQVSYLAVDGLYQKYPKLVRDLFWDSSQPELPYTEGAMNFKTDPFLGSTMTMNIPTKEKGWHINPIPEERQVSDLWVKSQSDIASNGGCGTSPSSPRSPRDEEDDRSNNKLNDNSHNPSSSPKESSQPSRYSSVTPRSFSSRSRFLSSLMMMKGNSHSALSSRCASKCSINSTGTGAGTVAHAPSSNARQHQKSPTPTSTTGRTSINVVDVLDHASNWQHILRPERSPPQRQWSVGGLETGVNMYSGTAIDQQFGATDTLTTPTPINYSENHHHHHINDPAPATIIDISETGTGATADAAGTATEQRRVTFEENVIINIGDDDVGADAAGAASMNEQNTLLQQSSDSVGTLLSSIYDSDPPNGSDSEQLTINSRSLLLPDTA